MQSSLILIYMSSDPEKTVQPKWPNLENESHSEALRIYQTEYSGLTSGEFRRVRPDLHEELRDNNELWQLATSEYGNDPYDCWRKNWSHLTRGTVRRERQGLDAQLRKYELLDRLPTQEDRKRERGQKALYKYQTKYTQITRDKHEFLTGKQLKEIDPPLHEELKKAGFLWQLTKSQFGNDPIAYQRIYFPGNNASKLAKIKFSLYRKILRERLSDLLPEFEGKIIEESTPKTPEIERKEALVIKKYQLKHPGLTIEQLKIVNWQLYEELKEAKVLWQLTTSKYGADPVQTYNEEHKGKTKEQLRREKLAGLIGQLRKEDFLEIIPKGKTGPKVKRVNSE